jgi:hypothetical protein
MARCTLQSGGGFGDGDAVLAAVLVAVVVMVLGVADGRYYEPRHAQKHANSRRKRTFV